LRIRGTKHANLVETDRLSAKNTAAAYVCPVCGTIFRTRTCIRIVQEVPVQEKQIHISFTKKAAMFIAGGNPDVQQTSGSMKWSVRADEKSRAKREKAFGAVLSSYLNAALYGGEKDPETFNEKNPTKRQLRKQAKLLRKRNKDFGSLVTQNINFSDFKDGDIMLIDYANGGLVISKKEKQQDAE